MLKLDVIYRIIGVSLSSILLPWLLGAQVSAQPVTLGDFQWQNRLLIACDLDPEAIHPSRKRFATTAARIALQDFAETDGARKLALINLGANSWNVLVDGRAFPPAELASLDYICPDCEYEYSEAERVTIADRLACRAGDQMLALIGLDGQIKQTWRDAVPPADDVFALIDAMPMRQLELQQAPRD